MCASWSGNSYGVTMRSARGVAFSEAMGTSPLVAAFKNAMREYLHVCVALDAKSCIGCTHANTWSEAGHRLYRITGLCEECWVKFMAYVTVCSSTYVESLQRAGILLLACATVCSCVPQ